MHYFDFLVFWFFFSARLLVFDCYYWLLTSNGLIFLFHGSSSIYLLTVFLSLQLVMNQTVMSKEKRNCAVTSQV
jgi:hypothetical protein